MHFFGGQKNRERITKIILERSRRILLGVIVMYIFVEKLLFRIGKRCISKKYMNFVIRKIFPI